MFQLMKEYLNYAMENNMVMDVTIFLNVKIPK